MSHVLSVGHADQGGDWGGTATPGAGLAAVDGRTSQKGNQQGRQPDGQA
jgi:hypothetical protein